VKDTVDPAIPSLNEYAQWKAYRLLGCRVYAAWFSQRSGGSADFFLQQLVSPFKQGRPVFGAFLRKPHQQRGTLSNVHGDPP